MAEPKLRVDAVMTGIERDVRTRLRRHLIKRGGHVLHTGYPEHAVFPANEIELAVPPQTILSFNPGIDPGAAVVGDENDKRLAVPVGISCALTRNGRLREAEQE